MKSAAPRLLASLAVLTVTFLAGGCRFETGSPGEPIEVQYYRISSAPPADSTLIILLPGIQSHASAFERRGFVAMVPPGSRIDLVTADVHMGYFEARNLHTRLREDVILPARERGYRHIEILGVSLGGLGGLLYATQFPEDIERVTALSPYVGKSEIIEEIQDAGGVASWDPGAIDPAEPRDRLLWRTLKELHHETRRDASPEIIVGVGKNDRFAAANTFFSEEVLGREPLVVPGGHNWPTWRNLFEKLVLSRGLRTQPGG